MRITYPAVAYFSGVHFELRAQFSSIMVAPVYGSDSPTWNWCARVAIDGEHHGIHSDAIARTHVIDPERLLDTSHRIATVLREAVLVTLSAAVRVRREGTGSSTCVPRMTEHMADVLFGDWSEWLNILGNLGPEFEHTDGDFAFYM